jgi:signal peptidase I
MGAGVHGHAELGCEQRQRDDMGEPVTISANQKNLRRRSIRALPGPDKSAREPDDGRRVRRSPGGFMSLKSSAPRAAARWWYEYRGTLLFLVLMLAFRSAWADWVSVPTGSMNPTILEGDRVLVDKHVYGLRIPWTLTRITDGRDPVRGEIVVFDSPDDGISLVKRVIGVPGDLIALDERGLSINGVHADYQPGEQERVGTLLSGTRAWDPDMWQESGVLPAHQVMRIPAAAGRSLSFFGPVRVPEEHYFMLGDSRDNSRDSRYIGFVPRDNIVGRASSVVLSFNPERYYLPRRGRYFESLY